MNGIRTGGDLVVETLVALGASTVFGEPGQHALGMFDALRRSSLRYVGCRTEASVAFAADGHARATGAVTPFMVSTGPGSLGRSSSQDCNDSGCSQGKAPLPPNVVATGAVAGSRRGARRARSFRGGAARRTAHVRPHAPTGAVTAPGMHRVFASPGD
jgi:acetolactate synthase-1/2/3 large subunit